MGSLANLYISQSYTSLIHLGNDTTASAALVELQDGLGNGLNISVNTQGHISASNVFASGLDVTGTSDFTGKVNIDSHFTASTIPYYNSYDPFYSNAVRVTGSYNSQYGYPPTLEDVRVGWLVNGIGITNARVTSITIVSPTDRYFFLDQCCPAASQYYTFTGQTLAAVNITGSLIVSDNLVVSGTFDIEGGVRINDDIQITGSVDISNNLTASNAEFRNKLKVDTIEQHTTNNGVTILSNVSLAQNIDVTGSLTASAAFIETDLIVSGTLFAKEVHTLIESSSIIFSTGSNILGDSIADIQTLNGKVIVSGSEEITGSLQVRNDISSSTISGIGNVTLYSQSVDYRLDNLETYSGSAEAKFLAIQASTASLNAFTASADAKFVEIEASTSSLNNFTASQETKNNTLELYTASVDDKFVAVGISTASLNSFTGSLVATFVTTASFNPFTESVNAFTQSTNNRLNNLESTSASVNISISNLNTTTASLNSSITQLNQSSASQQISINALNAISASIVTTGSNSFVGNQTITGSLIVTGSMIYSGSVSGQDLQLSISSNTASIDCGAANFFELTLVSGSATNINPINIGPGKTITLKVTQPSVGFGTVTYSSSKIKFASGFTYTATQLSNAVDIITFVTFDNSVLYGAAANQMI